MTQTSSGRPAVMRSVAAAATAVAVAGAGVALTRDAGAADTAIPDADTAAAAAADSGIRVNAGGPDVTAPDGTVWRRDSSDLYVGGSKVAVTGAVAATAIPEIFRSERRGVRGYNVSGLPQGTYAVTLHFAETEYAAAGRRVFDVSAEGRPVVNGLDIVAAVGPRRALTHRVDVVVADGALDLGFTARVGRSTISGFEVVPLPAGGPTAAPTTPPATPEPTVPPLPPVPEPPTVPVPQPPVPQPPLPAPAQPGAWPAPAETVPVSATIRVTGTFDGALRRYVASGAMGDGGQSESQQPLFQLADGASISNVVLGRPAADGIHCQGACTITNVWWEDVGEDAATFRGADPRQTVTIQGGGARSATDKVFQHNGAGTVVIDGFQVQDFGKLYRSCGHCSTMFDRHVVVRNVTATLPGQVLAAINSNYGDTADLSGLTIVGDPSRRLSICDRYRGNSTGAEPVKVGSGNDGVSCRYDPAAVVYR